jgi:hypothetical protein
MNRFHVTIRDITAWTITLQANDSIHAENLALNLFQTATDRSEHFEDDSNTTVQVEEAVA